MQTTVVVPAHNEENVIGHALRGILEAGEREVDVIVVANGCTDRTVERARAAGNRVRVVEVAEASKIGALNAGDDAAESFPIAFVDADVVVSGNDLVALARRLDASPQALVASPAMTVLPSRSWWVRQYYRVWALTDYRTSGHIGSGVYMLSAAGRARFDRFPEVIADDLFVQRLFSTQERLTPSDLAFAVRAPGSVAALIGRNTRIAAGNRQLAAAFPELAPPSGSAGAASLLKRALRRPTLWPGVAVYTFVYLTAHQRAKALLRRRQAIGWTRDESTRAAAA
ncbi:MAG: glycosyltransferase family A protein [Microbacterium sp.]